jgi:CRP-like cAMP-binding protein
VATFCNGNVSRIAMSDYLNAAFLFTVLFHLSNLMAFLAFLLRDQLQLRLMMAVSLFLQGLYYFSIPGGPFYDPLFWKIVSFLANAAIIILVFSGRLDFGIPADLRQLYETIHVLTPGQFRKLIAASSRVTTAQNPLLVADTKPESLFYLLNGQAQIKKGTHSAYVNAGVFLGEVAFLNDSNASATVELAEGGHCIQWNAKELKSLMKRDKAIDIAMRGLFNHDLAQKVATSMPLQPHL